MKVFSKHNRNIVPMSLQQLWMAVHNLNQFKPVSIPTWMGRAHEDQLLAEELSMAAMEAMSQFSSGCGPWQAAIVPVDTCTGGQPLWDSVGYQKQKQLFKGHEVGRRRCGDALGQLEMRLGVYRMHCSHV